MRNSVATFQESSSHHIGQSREQFHHCRKFRRAQSWKVGSASSPVEDVGSTGSHGSVMWQSQVISHILSSSHVLPFQTLCRQFRNRLFFFSLQRIALFDKYLYAYTWLFGAKKAPQGAYLLSLKLVHLINF